jgi:hypothetical protein
MLITSRNLRRNIASALFIALLWFVVGDMGIRLPVSVMLLIASVQILFAVMLNSKYKELDNQ